MNLADVFTFLFSILGTLIVLVGYWLLAFALAPQFVERAAARMSSAPVKTALLGAVTLVPLVVIGLTVSGQAPAAAVKVLGVGLALVGLLGALLGSSGFALLIGKGMLSPRDAAEPWRRVLRGGIVLGLTFVLPFVGTFIMLPAALLMGFGALVRCWRVKAAPTPAATPLPTPTL